MISGALCARVADAAGIIVRWRISEIPGRKFDFEILVEMLLARREKRTRLDLKYVTVSNLPFISKFFFSAR